MTSPFMPLESLQKLVTASHALCVCNAHLAGETEESLGRGAEDKTSEMGVRRALANLFERLAKDDVVFEGVHREWQATTDKRTSPL